MRDLLLSFLIGGTVVMGATEMIGITDVLQGQDPSAAVRSAVPDFTAPNLPAMPSLPEFIPDAARSVFSGSANAAPDPEATAGPATEPHPMYIARTGGTGVRTRAACLDEAPGQGVATEGSMVTILRQGGRECPGWAFVTNGKSQFWVRMNYLDASPPRAAPPRSSSDPAKAPSPTTPGQDENKADGGKSDDQRRDDDQRKDEEKPVVTPAPTPASTPSASPTAEPTPKRPPPTPKATPTEEPQEDES